STPDRAMSQVYEIPGRPQHHALAACITASALGYYAGDGAAVRPYFGYALVIGHLIYDDLLGSFTGDFGRISGKQFLFYGIWVDCLDHDCRIFVNLCSHRFLHSGHKPSDLIENGLATLSGPDGYGVHDRAHENLAVPRFSSAVDLYYCLDRCVDQVARHHYE